jgi:hypothetical protein
MGYKIGDKVRLLASQWPEEYPIGSVWRVLGVTLPDCPGHVPSGVWLRPMNSQGLGLFYNEEVEPAEKHVFKVGDKVRVIANYSSHAFPIGSVVTLTMLRNGGAPRQAAGAEVGAWYVKTEDVAPIAETTFRTAPEDLNPLDSSTHHETPAAELTFGPLEHVSPTGGRRANTGKLPVDLVPASLILGVAAVLKAGAEKYAPRNWEKGMELSIPYACAMRHMLAWLGGQDLDPETNRPHWEHVATNAAFIIEYQQRIAAGTLPASLDDRPKAAPV